MEKKTNKNKTQKQNIVKEKKDNSSQEICLEISQDKTGYT